MELEEYYIFCQKIANSKKTIFCTLNLSTRYGLFLCIFIRIFFCRGPPPNNLYWKKQIDRRKERWEKAQKEGSIKIIHIL